MNERARERAQTEIVNTVFPTVLIIFDQYLDRGRQLQRDGVTGEEATALITDMHRYLECIKTLWPTAFTEIPQSQKSLPSENLFS